MEALIEFLRTQSIMQIAPKSDEPWIANLLMVCEEPQRLYFVGSERTHYGTLLKAQSIVAFATAWHAEDDHANRKGVQGIGLSRIVQAPEEIAHAVALHNAAYPEFREQITTAWIGENDTSSRVWAIDVTYIKFWNDALYGRDGTTTFTFTPNTQ